MTKVSIILPTFNEVDNIVDLIIAIDRAVHDSKEIIVVDDDSPDGTSQAVRTLIDRGEIQGVRLITRTHDRGLTNSIKEGIASAHGAIVVWMDCDFSMPPRIIPKLIAEIDRGYDVAVGSRFVPGGSFKRDTASSQDSWLPVMLSRLMNLVIRVLLGFSFKDYTSGFIAIKRTILQRIELRGDYGEYFIDLMFWILIQKYRVVEVPYVCLPRRKGSSKTGNNIADYTRRGALYVRVAFGLFFAKLRHNILVLLRYMRGNQQP